MFRIRDFSKWKDIGAAPPVRAVAGGLAAAVLAALAACGGDGAIPPPVDPLQPYRDQVVNWQKCDADVVGGGSFVPEEILARLSCATIRVPLDYSNPTKGDAVVAVSRVAAGERSQRLGAILVNPGGPGGDGLAWSLNLAVLWGNASESTTTGQQLRTIVQRYDMVGFSPRGVGASSRMYCGTSGMLRPEHHSSDRSEANVAAMLFNANALGDACLRNPLVKYINTDATVRDMDLIRGLLGDAKFNYVGISYGTWLGAWYASLFPERVGRMVLDSSMDVTGNIDVNVVMQPMAMQRVLDEFIAPFASRHPDRFGIGTNAAEIANVYRTLPEPMRVAFGQQANLHSILSKTHRVAKGAQLISAARGMNQVLIDNPGIDDSRKLDEKLMEYEFAPDFGGDIEIRGLAQAMIEPYLRAFTPTPSPVELSTFNSVFNTVVCNDTVATSTDPQYWVKLGNEMATSYPYEGGSVTRSLCATWGGPSVAKPPLSRAGASAPILMLQSEFDAQTATEGARRSFDALPQAHLVVVTGAYSHGVVPESNACVDATIGTYFANGVVPGRSSTCAEPPLPYEGTADATRMAKTSAGETDAAAQARDALRQSLDAISTSGARF
ncbi:MAG: hypothetical protein ABS43_12885 [Bordetella sp. SCN 67-23]|nr:alpha/beta fold hydrolase [Burkholderiales bacterium]ODS73732.1 MAG: hypothetical protein ABS43_12885 [Bordetella sp. SCN 67-23]OJW89951.1 MAG: hypothetical protein BGO71_26860 [Burkholderiales bacterium 67-32]